MELGGVKTVKRRAFNAVRREAFLPGKAPALVAEAPPGAVRDADRHRHDDRPGNVGIQKRACEKQNPGPRRRVSERNAAVKENRASGHLRGTLAALQACSLLLFVETLQAFHEIDHFRTVGLARRVIIFGGADDDVDDVREAAAATAPFAHRMIDLRRNDQLPTVLVKELVDDVRDFPVGDVIAAADEHGADELSNLTFSPFFLLKRMAFVKKFSSRCCLSRSSGPVSPTFGFPQ